MAIYRHLIQMESVTGTPEDRCVNVLHSSALSDADAAGFATDIVVAMGSVLPGQTNGLTEYYSGSLSRAVDAHLIKTYDLSDPTPRSPVDEQTWTMLAKDPAGTALPREVAACLSYQGVRVSGLPQARRRGRMFLGPLTALAGVPDTLDGDLALSTTFIADVVLFAQALLASGPAVWSVYSPTNNNAVAVENGWVDDAFDTQRRRGIRAGSRTLWS